MKTFKYLIGMFILASVFFACEDEYEPVSDFADAGFYTSYGSQVGRSAVVGDYAAFMDISQGAIYHHWAVDSGNYFLEGPIPRGVEDFTSYIMNEGDTSIHDINANILFAKGDTAFQVRLFNVFEDSVAWRGVDETTGWPYEAKNHSAVYHEDGEWAGKWVFEYNILVDVYDTIITDMELRNQGVVIDHTVEGDTVKIKAGEELQFADLSAELDNTSRPDGTTWRILNAPENSGENEVYTTSSKTIADITFKKMGNFYIELTAKREAQEGLVGDTETYLAPIVINVAQSDLPFEQQGQIRQNKDKTVNVIFNALIADVIHDDAKNLFTVNVEGNPDPIAVTKVERVENNQDNLLLTLAEEIYYGDVVTMTYTKDETIGITSQDERALESFTDVKVFVYDPNMLDLTAASFEDALGDYWADQRKGTGTVEYSTEQAATGNQSIKGVNPGTSGNQMRFSSNADALLTIESGVTYTVKYKRFLTADTDLAGGDKFYIGEGGTLNVIQINNVDNLLDPGQKCHLFTGNPTEAWYEMEFEWTADKDYVGAFLTVQVNPKAGTFYYDDFYISPKVEKP
ncbi:hypothetical protein [Labilibacter marinus]|uniref:hypothetical protein n=1 Tax=Labilibacter marinus TaxID=1477105 RepID=UPI000830627D|nr:hypothetical protein [Labilibacter marinus]